MWGRLSTAELRHGGPSAQEHEELLEIARKTLLHRDETALRRAADMTHAAALRVPDHEFRLVVIGYWSAASYFFRYHDLLDWKYMDAALDSFLSALDEFKNLCGPAGLGAEVTNLAAALEAARIFKGDVGSLRAMQLLNWASICPLGSPLPPFCMEA